MAKVFLKKNEDIRVRSGHSWVFSNEVSKVEGAFENGDIVELLDCRGESIGWGFYNANSLISVRLFNKCYKGNFHDYAKENLLKAYKLRTSCYPDRTSFRMCFSESDFMPGLIIDKYNSTFVLQVSSKGMDKYIEDVVKILKDSYEAQNIFTRHESHLRQLEGLSEDDVVYLGWEGEEIIDDGKIKYRVDFKHAQKTGFYFDQCDNREFIRHFVKGKNVLDAFCNCGGFGLHASLAGASSVDFLDTSVIEIENARYNFQINRPSFKSIVGGFIADDVFDFLQNSHKAGKEYDVIMLDPPAFAKNKKSVHTALKGYEKLNKLALQIIRSNGYLITSSCSHHVSADDFIKAVVKAALKSKRNIKLLYFNGASLDHPSLPSMPETSYLKFAVFNVV